MAGSFTWAERHLPNARICLSNNRSTGMTVKGTGQVAEMQRCRDQFVRCATVSRSH